MSLVASGKISALFSLIAVCAAVLVMVRLARRGRVPKIRRLAALDAIREAVGRAVEMGKPVHAVPGVGYLSSGADAAQTVAGLSVLDYTASLCAKYGARLISTNQNPEVLPVQEQIVQQAYMAEGKSAAYRPEMVRHLSPANMSYAAGAAGIIEREEVAANIFVGSHGMEALIMLEAGSRSGAIQIGGTATLTRSMDFAVGTDFLLIGEDIFAAGAYLSNEPAQLASIAAQDCCKIAILALAIIGVVLAVFGNRTLTTILRT
ncbi:MAG: DUF6754 domain-containing protein [archaeon]